MNQGGTLYYLLSDHLGSTAAVLTGSGALVGGTAAQKYYPFGTTRNDGFKNQTDKQFTGHQKEGDFIFMQSRFYDPSVGRFLQPDSIVPDPMNPQSLNRYSYVLNNPLAYTDPTGHSQENAWQNCFVLGCGGVQSSRPSPGPSAPVACPVPGPGGGCVPVPDLDYPNCGLGCVAQFFNPAPSFCTFTYPLCGDYVAEPTLGERGWAALDTAVFVASILAPLKIKGPRIGSIRGSTAWRLVADETGTLRIGGETSSTRLGRAIHAAWDYGSGFEREFRLPSGRRVDAINFETREIVELKPNNVQAIQAGRRQLDRYLGELDVVFPGEKPWTGRVQTYEP